MAHIKREVIGTRNGRDIVVYRVRWHTPDGKWHSETKYKKVDATDRVTEIEHSLRTSTYVDPAAGRETFKTYAERWRKLQPHRASTAISVEVDLRKHVYPKVGARPIATIRQSDVQALITGLASKLAPSTLERVRARVSNVFSAAVRDRVIVHTPCFEIALPRARRKSAVTDVLTVEQVHALTDAMPARYRALVLTGAGTGLRPGELFGLTLDRVRFLERTVVVDQQLVRVRGEGVRLAELKTDTSYRSVPLPTTVAETLAAHLGEWPADGEPGLVFTNERGAPIQQHPFSAVWTRARDRAGLPSWATPHDLRHFYASMLIRRGESAKAVQARLGHSSAKVTFDVYGHLWPDEDDRTRAAVDAVLARPRPQERRGARHIRAMNGLDAPHSE